VLNTTNTVLGLSLLTAFDCTTENSIVLDPTGTRLAATIQRVMLARKCAESFVEVVSKVFRVHGYMYVRVGRCIRLAKFGLHSRHYGSQGLITFEL
jgi:hypothetical protein